jgi:hypothetical protein
MIRMGTPTERQLIGLIRKAGLLALLSFAWCSTGHGQAPASADALLTDGKRFEHGIGRPQDLDRAVERYCRAGALGSVQAHYQLGWLYLTGRMGKVDEVLAAGWLARAADRGHADASRQLKRLNANGADLGDQVACVMRSEMVSRRMVEAGPTTPKVQEDDLFEVRELGRDDIAALVRRLAPEYRLNPQLVLAVIAVESNFNPNARSTKDARGLMQLVPATAQRFGVRDIWDPVQNLRGGMAYLRWLLDRFDGDLDLALAGYNAGEQAVRRYNGIPPFAETRAYVQRVRSRLGASNRSGLSGEPARLRARFSAPPNSQD